jgi:predicted unusual protein kinase regulating ubiquinone biosynthesis (AarF/ABC1/UbiB family)
VSDRVPRGFTRRSTHVVKTAGSQAARHAALRVRRADPVELTESQRRAARATAQTLALMKGGAMKVGQLASFVDLGFLPEAYRELWQDELAILRESVPPTDIGEIRRVLRRTWGAEPEAVLDAFDPTPVAAASIGQVHRGRTRDGRDVAIKVQYPDIAQAVRTDVGTAQVLMRFAKAFAPKVDIRALAAELRERILEELDFEMEADHQRAFARAYRGHPFIAIPDVVGELSGEHVLVCDWMGGRGFDDVRAAGAETRDRYGEILVRFFFGSTDLLGRFHADPHPGNHKLLDDGRVAFLDFGASKVVPRAYYEASRDAALGLVTGDAAAVAQRMVDLGVVADPGAVTEPLHAAILAGMAWVAEDREVRMDADYVRAGLETLADPELRSAVRRIDIPPEELWFQRMSLGVIAVLAQLEATANWHRIAMETWAGAPPATALGAEHQRWLAR